MFFHFNLLAGCSGGYQRMEAGYGTAGNCNEQGWKQIGNISLCICKHK